MRAILIDWLVQVQIKFRLLQETMYMTVAIIDRFLQVGFFFFSSQFLHHCILLALVLMAFTCPSIRIIQFQRSSSSLLV